MYDPDLYDAYSEFQRRDAREMVPHLVSKMGWKDTETILDFGCGSGFNTKNILLPSIKAVGLTHSPKVYAIDVSKKMIDFASIKYSHSNITYMVADVMKDDCEFPCQFDKIFSFHVLHWILDQEKALKCLYRLLKPDGEIALYFIASAAVFTVYDSMSRNPTWAPFLADVKSFIPKSYYSPDPARDLHDLMNSMGYFVQEASNCMRKFVFASLEEMIEAAMAANPFIHRIPLHLQQDYKDDFREAFLPLVHHVSNSSKAIEVDYEVVLIRAQKL